jgi:hypothetical protein
MGKPIFFTEDARLLGLPETSAAIDRYTSSPFKHVKKVPHNLKAEDAKHRPSRMSATWLHRQRPNIAPMIHDSLEEKPMELAATPKMGNHADDA